MLEKLIIWLRGDCNSIKRRFFYYPRDLIHYNVFYRIRRKSLLEYQRSLIDKVEHNRDINPIDDQYLLLGEQQFSYLKDHGLEPNHKILDYGCGFMRAGRFIIGYLNPKNYVGADISMNRLRTAKKLLLRYGITEEKYQTFQINDLYLSEIEGFLFDYIWAFSVFQYLPNKNFFLLLNSLNKLMIKGGIFFFDFPENEKILKSKIQYFRTKEQVKQIAESAGFQIEIMKDWPLDSIMAKLTVTT